MMLKELCHNDIQKLIICNLIKITTYPKGYQCNKTSTCTEWVIYH